MINTFDEIDWETVGMVIPEKLVDFSEVRKRAERVGSIYLALEEARKKRLRKIRLCLIAMVSVIYVFLKITF